MFLIVWKFVQVRFKPSKLNFLINRLLTISSLCNNEKNYAKTINDDRLIEIEKSLANYCNQISIIEQQIKDKTIEIAFKEKETVEKKTQKEKRMLV